MALRLDFTPTEKPDWRHSGSSTSFMVDEIVEYCTRYVGEQQKSRYRERAYSEYLHQVNHIEKEGFDTYAETQEAISKGALVSAGSSDYTPGEDPRLDSLCSLYRALGHWFHADAPPRLCIQELEKCHKLLLGSSSQAEIAGRIRCREHEVVFVNTEDKGVHVFCWPTEVASSLEKLLDETQAALESLKQAEGQSRDKVLGLLKLGGAFFLAFENIHPFLDGNGRCGRILLAYILQSILPFPNVLLVEREGDYGQPPFVAPCYYYDCFQDVQSKQEFAVGEDGRPIFTKEAAQCTLDHPRDLTALIIEGVYVCWKRFFNGTKREREETDHHEGTSAKCPKLN